MGLQILWYYSEVIGPGGPNTSKYLARGELFQGGSFFRDSTLYTACQKFSLKYFRERLKIRKNREIKDPQILTLYGIQVKNSICRP